MPSLQSSTTPDVPESHQCLASVNDVTFSKTPVTYEPRMLPKEINQLGYRVEALYSWHDRGSYGDQVNAKTVSRPCGRSDRHCHPERNTFPNGLVCYYARDLSDVPHEDFGQLRRNDRLDYAFTEPPKRPVLTIDRWSHISRILQAQTPPAMRILPPISIPVIPDLNSQTEGLESTMDIAGVQRENLPKIGSPVTQDSMAWEAHDFAFAGHSLLQPSSDAVSGGSSSAASLYEVPGGVDRAHICPSRPPHLPHPLESRSFRKILDGDSQQWEELIWGNFHHGPPLKPLDSIRVEELHREDWLRTVTRSNRLNAADSITMLSAGPAD